MRLLELFKMSWLAISFSTSSKYFLKNQYQNRRVSFSKENLFELEILNYEKYPE